MASCAWQNALLPSAFCLLISTMAYPPDVIVLDMGSLVHARLGRGRKDPQLVQAKSYRLPEGTFTPAVVTPELTNEASLTEVLRRLRLETGRWDKVSLLLPDSWFRINLLEFPSLPDRPNEADQIIRWSLKRTMPIDPSELRLKYEVQSKSTPMKVLTLSAVDATLAAIEKTFSAAGMEVVMIEPIGLNIWNAVTAREAQTTRDRLFLYVRDNDFTTAVFRGAQPLFVRSRDLSGSRTIEQEIRLSATYLRDTFRTDSFENCYLAGNGVGDTLASILQSEFSAPVRIVSLRDFVEQEPGDVAGYEAELAACTGVFTA
jgi:type IV pilus assembly protein PilM